MSDVVKSLDLAAAMSGNLASPDQPPQAEGRSYDNNNRVARVERMPDGNFRTSTEGATQGNYADAVKSASDPWEWAQDPRTRQPLAAHQVKGDSIISIDGREMTVDQAVMIGLLSPFQQGGAPAANKLQGVTQETEQQQPEWAEEVHPDLQTEAVDMRTEETFTAVVENTSAGTQIAAVQELATDGEIGERRMAQLASEMRIEPTQLQAMIDTMRPAFEAQANKAVEAYGVDPFEVWEWAQQHCPSKMQEAINRHLTKRNTHGYSALAQEFVENLDTINPDLILSAPINGGTASLVRGRIVLTLQDGRQMTWSEALALGVMKLEAAR